jgi:pimeloyl-ACP methyl ester carboxylesterase
MFGILTQFLGLLVFSQAPSVPADSGTFHFLLGGKAAGSEEFSLANGEIKSKVHVVTSGGTKDFDLVATTSANRLRSSRISKDGKTTLLVEANAQGVSVSYESSTKPVIFQFDDVGTPVSDFSPATLYFLASAVSRGKEGKQTISTFRIQDIVAGDCILEYLGRDGIQTKDGVKQLDRFAASGNVGADWFEDNGKIVIANLRNFGHIAYRDGYEPVAGLDPAWMEHRDKYSAAEISVPSFGLFLAATLTIPKTAGRHPAILLIGGEGGQDRNGDTLRAGSERAKLFGILADRLGASGFVVLRADERGVGSSQGSREDAGFKTTRIDNQYLIDYLSRIPLVDRNRIILVGQGEGGLIATMLMTQNKSLAGCILLATPATSYDKVLLNRYEAMAKDPKRSEVERAQSSLDLAKLKGSFTEAKAGKTTTQSGYPGVWLKEIAEYDPGLDFGKIQKPVLLISGAADTFISPKSMSAIAAKIQKAGNKDVSSILVPGVGYSLTTPDNKVAPAGLEAIERWLTKRYLKTPDPE